MLFRQSIKKLKEQRQDISFFENLFFFSFAVIVFFSLLFTDVKIWGDKTEAMFDIWFLQHTLSGMIFSFLLLSLSWTRKYSLLIVVVVAFSWEFIEFFLETDSHSAIMAWMAGLEHPLNRYVADPLAAILGYIIVSRYPEWIHTSFFMNFCFAILHIWLGDSMVIQQFLY